MNYELAYLDLLHEVRNYGSMRTYRNGNALSIFGGTLRITSLLTGKFPILTTRKMSFKPIMGELAAFVTGSSRLQEFKDFGCNYWDMNAAQWSHNIGRTIQDMDVGRIYGVQWRDWAGYIDQLRVLVNGIRRDPTSRRHIMTAWNPAELDDMCLPPCHILVQAYVTDGRLDLSIYMRSVDLCLGLPTDVVLYAGLLIALAKECDLEPGELVFQFGDMHIYEKHLPTLVEQFTRPFGVLPSYTHLGDLFLLHPDDFELVGYNPQEPLKYELL